MQGQVRTAEQKLALLATAANGVVARSELRLAGFTKAEIDGRVAKGLLIPEFRGVYRVGHRAASTEARYTAAVKACGAEALLSGRAAGYGFALLKGSPPPPEVIAPTERTVKGVTTHCGKVAREDQTIWRGIPITTVARTLTDLAGTLPLNALARAFHEAEIKHGTTPEQIEAALQRRPNAKGAANLRRITRGEEPVTLSRLERRFLELLREAGLPLPETNRPTGSYRVDCRWPEHRLTVELDSYRYHRSRHAWEQDRRRDREARARGDEIRRYTWGDVFEAWRPMLAELAGLLATQPPAPGRRGARQPPR
jgi:very-short-patch-repair endonuclease